MFGGHFYLISVDRPDIRFSPFLVSCHITSYRGKGNGGGWLQGRQSRPGASSLHGHPLRPGPTPLLWPLASLCSFFASLSSSLNLLLHSDHIPTVSCLQLCSSILRVPGVLSLDLSSHSIFHLPKMFSQRRTISSVRKIVVTAVISLNVSLLYYKCKM